MEQYTNCELPALLEEAMQVITVLRWPGRETDPGVRAATQQVMSKLYQARRDAMEIGCECCQRASREGRCEQHPHYFIG